MTARRRLFFLPIAALLATACGGLVESEPTVQGPPIGEHDAGAPIADASVGSSSPPTPTGKAPVTSRCLMSDGPFEITGSQAASQIELAVRVENGKVGVYVSNNLETHRYILTNEAPCLLDRDLTFGTNGKIVSREGFSLDDNGNVWTSNVRVSRVFPGATLICAMDPAYFDDDGNALYDPGPLYLEEGGRTGWALSGADGELGRFSFDGTSCSVTLVKSPFSFLLRQHTPRDSQSHYHVIENGRIDIYDSDSARVGSYFAGLSPLDATACAGGVCVMSASGTGYTVTYVNESGAPRASIPAIDGLIPHRIAADHNGPVFLAGANDPSREAVSQVVVQLAPAPP